MTDLQLIIVGGVLSFVFGLLSWSITNRVAKQEKEADEQKAEIKQLSDAVKLLQTTAVTDSHVRKVFKEEIELVNNTLGKLLEITHSIEVYMAEDKGYKAAQAAMVKRKSDTQD